MKEDFIALFGKKKMSQDFSFFISKIIALLMLFFGAATLIFGIHMADNCKKADEMLESFTGSAVATVTKVEASDTKSSYKVWYSFTVNGEVVNGMSKSDREFSEGDTLDISYDPNDPKAFTSTPDLKEYSSIRHYIVLMMICGTAFTVFGILGMATNLFDKNRSRFLLKMKNALLSSKISNVRLNRR